MVTDQQVRRLMMLMNREGSKATAASKAGMDRKTARKYVNIRLLPSQIKKPHTWPTRKDPFKDVWDKIKGMLKVSPGLEAVTIFDYLQKKRPGHYPDGQLRTLQRRIRIWRSLEGPAKEVFFPQEHRPGELSESDFTNMNDLGITIQKERFEHLLYHYVLTYSNWEAGNICFSESFESMSAGYQNAVWQLGGVTKKHRTDRMSAAVNKDCNPEKFTARYKALLSHYGVMPERTNPASANENGDVEQRHYRFKKAVSQALMLRGSSDFFGQKEYERFLMGVFDRLNSNRLVKLHEEIDLLKPLPARRLDDYKPIEATVSPSSTIHVLHNTYSVNSRLIGERVQVKIYVALIEVVYANTVIERIPRLKGVSKHRVDYRHIIDWLVRKPGAFENFRYRSDMFPSSQFRMAYDRLKRDNPLRANAEYLKILHLAALEGEGLVESVIRSLLLKDQALSSGLVGNLIAESSDMPKPTDVRIDELSLSAYDELLVSGAEVLANG